MKEETRIQIENMKAQTFGVEVEGNNITRERAAQKAAEYFGTGRYEDTAYRNGYSTWSAWDADGREWKFQKDVSIDGPDSQKCEMVTPILTYTDMELLQGLVRTLRKAGMRSDYTRGCGVHIHIGAKGHTPQTLRNLVNIMAAHESQIAKAIKVDRNREARYCRTVDPRFLEAVNRKKPKTMEALANVWYESQNCEYGRNQHYNSSRYHMTNLHATFTKGTIEFRLFQFDAPHDGKLNGMHAGQLKAMIQLCLAISQLAKQVRFASPKPQQTENEAYAFRCWMLGLGFIGDEFKTARDFFLANMDGNCAWRHTER
ncbi:MAG: amidoligase family protein [Lachnospiraceae bacterium]|nr:amidoligase family protein [Lachnospiraceae bacterium]